MGYVGFVCALLQPIAGLAGWCYWLVDIPGETVDGEISSGQFLVEMRLSQAQLARGDEIARSRAIAAGFLIRFLWLTEQSKQHVARQRAVV